MSDIEIRRPVEDWAKEKATPSRLFIIARGLERWPAGRLVTEAQFDAAVARVSKLRFK